MKLVENGLQTKFQIVRKQDDANETRSFSPFEFLAELSSHIPDMWEQTTRYYGIYSAPSRGAQKIPVIKSLDLNLELEPPKRPVSK